MSVSSLFGTLDGSLQGQNVSQPGPDGPPPAPVPSPAGLFGSSPPLQPPNPLGSTSGGVVGQGVGAGLNRQRGALEEDASGGLGGALGAAAKPFKVLLDILGQLDRPQQFLFAAVTKGLESGSAFEGLKAGSSAFFFRTPEAGGVKRRVSPDELVDTIAREMFQFEGSATAQLSPAARFSSMFAVSAAVDPLMFVPSAWYSKAGVGIKSLTNNIVAADKARYAVTAGTDMIHAAARARNNAVADFLRSAGRTDQPLGRVIMNAAQDATDDEIAIIRDMVTGVGIESLDPELSMLMRQAIDAGEDVSPEAVAGVMERALGRLTEDKAAELTDQISGFLSKRRNSPDRVELFQLKVGGEKLNVTFESGMGNELTREFLVGQLVNRAGLMPTEAMEKAGQVGEFLSGAVGKSGARISRKGFINKALAESEKRLPQKVSKRYMAALKQSVGTGRYWVDAVSAARLRGVFANYDLTNQAGRDIADIVAGVKNVDAVSDLPNAIAHREVLRSLVDADQRATKDMHILQFLMDPKAVLGDPFYARAKYGEDLFHAVKNAVGQQMDKIFVHGGKVLKEGGDMDKRLGLALFADELEATVRGAKSGELAENTRELAAAAVAARSAIRDNPELWQMYGGLKTVLAGFREGFVRRGFTEFAEGGISNYMARVYPRFRDSVEAGISNGMITPEEGARMIRRSKRDINAALSPLDIDYVQGNHVAFRHLKSRTLLEPLPGLETSAIKLMRAYTAGGLRKIYIEPMVQDINKASRSMPKWKKRYTNLWLKRMMGFEIFDDEVMNSLLSSANGMFGKAAQAATFGAVKADSKVFTDPRPATRVSLAVTRAFYRGLLGGSVGFVMKNFAQGVNTAASTGPFNYLRGVTMFVTNPIVDAKKGVRFRDLPAAKTLNREMANLMEDGLYRGGLGGGLKRAGIKFDELIFAPAKFSEFFNRGVAMSAGMNQFLRQNGKKLGTDNIRDLFVKHPDEFAKAVQFGQSVANETQFLYGIVGRSPLAGSVLGRMGLQFFSWPVKQVEFLRQGWKDEGSKFMLRYMAMSGLVSHMAESFEVDASGFTGFGFMPSQAAPSIQVLGHMNAAIVSALQEDNTEEASGHFKDMVREMENMIPMFLQIQKTISSIESIQTGESRDRRGRFVRNTNDPNREQPLSQLLDVSLNRINSSFGLPRISGEQAARLASLPDQQSSKFREGIRRIQRSNREEDKRYRRYLDRYIEAYHTGRFIDAQKIKEQAQMDSVYLTPEIIKREVTQKQTGQPDRVSKQIRPSSRVRIGAEIFRDDPELFRHMPGIIPLPPDALGGVKR